jgi:hypothetical protein
VLATTPSRGESERLARHAGFDEKRLASERSERGFEEDVETRGASRPSYS